MQRALVLFAALSVALLSACGALPPEESWDTPVPDGTISTDQAVWPAVLDFVISGGPDIMNSDAPAPDDNFVQLVSTVNVPGATAGERYIPFKTATASIILGTETVAMTDVVIELPDVVVAADVFPPDGLHLSNLRVTADDVAPVAFTELDANTRVAELSLDLTLQWALTTSTGETFDLADVAVDGMPVALTLTRDAESHVVVGTIAGSVAGDLIDTNFLTVHEASISLLAGAGY